jgi:hypothetical protein
MHDGFYLAAADHVGDLIAIGNVADNELHGCRYCFAEAVGQVVVYDHGVASPQQLRNDNTSDVPSSAGDEDVQFCDLSRNYRGWGVVCSSLRANAEVMKRANARTERDETMTIASKPRTEALLWICETAIEPYTLRLLRIAMAILCRKSS